MSGNRQTNRAAHNEKARQRAHVVHKGRRRSACQGWASRFDTIVSTAEPRVGWPPQRPHTNPVFKNRLVTHLYMNTTSVTLKNIHTYMHSGGERSTRLVLSPPLIRKPTYSGEHIALPTTTTGTHIEGVRCSRAIIRRAPFHPRHLAGEQVERARPGTPSARGPRHVEQPFRDALSVQQRLGGRPANIVVGQAGLVLLLLVD